MPLVLLPDEPCQVRVQPPVWLPRSSAFEPATYTFWDFLSGRTLPAFFSRTWDSAAACRATERCAAEPILDAPLVSAYGFSKSPSANFWVRMRDTASSIRRSVTRPAFTSSVSAARKSLYEYGTIIMSTPALTEVRTCEA